MFCECGRQLPNVAGEVTYHCPCGHDYILRDDWPQQKLPPRHSEELALPSGILTEGMRWTWRRWFCLHWKWESLGRVAGLENNERADRCKRCGVTRVREL